MRKENKKIVIIIMGAPGAGKGTQGELLSEKLNLYYFETSKILEEKFKEEKRGEKIKIEGKEYEVLKERKLWEAGKLCDPPFVTYLVQKKIKELFREGKSLLLSGSPRTLYEGERVLPLLEELYGKENIKIIFLDISAKDSIWRNSHRRICQLMRHPILYSEETKHLTKCPLDGSKLLRRKGLDDPETIKVRLKEYKERTIPLFDYFKRENFKVIKIDGSLPPAEVFENILKAIQK
ncbi:nucleoside monophosphate kinase [bacterium]|nr:nucleoside monophosphate kinase [bacterium]